jgi:hypothetical protein
VRYLPRFLIYALNISAIKQFVKEEEYEIPPHPQHPTAPKP